MLLLLATSGLIIVIYLPAAALTTLGVLALWNKLRPPKLWQVLLGTACLGFLPWLVVGISEGWTIGLQLAGSFLAYLPVLIPAVLWALQRRDSDGKFTPLAEKAGSLLVGYIVLVVLVVPASVVGLAVLSHLRN